MAYIDKDKLLQDIAETVIFSVRPDRPSAELRGARKIIDRIEAAPTADVVEVKHGRWIPVKLTRRTTEYKCSICGRWERTEQPYCNCGAKMDGETDGQTRENA